MPCSTRWVTQQAGYKMQAQARKIPETRWQHLDATSGLRDRRLKATVPEEGGKLLLIALSERQRRLRAIVYSRSVSLFPPACALGRQRTKRLMHGPAERDHGSGHCCATICRTGLVR